MSRSSKGFADFFPTAPSVLQQKKSRTTQERKRHDSSSSFRPVVSSHTTSISETAASLNSKNSDLRHGSHTNGVVHGHLGPEVAPLTQDESESVQGDLLNGVGSASSTSTASSIFDAHGRQQDPAPQKRNNQQELTPLTNMDSSSPGNNHSPARVKQESSSAGHPGTASCVPTLKDSGPPPTSTPSNTNVPKAGNMAPGKGQITGIKISYDPELDKTIGSKERRNRKPQYKEFVCKVRYLFPSSFCC